MKNIFMKKNQDENNPNDKRKINLKEVMNMDIKALKIKFSKNLGKMNKASTPQKKRKVVAFDMGSSMIKIVEGMYYKDELTIDKYITLKTPKDAIIDGEIKKAEELFLRLEQAMKENGIKAKYAICTNNSTLIINRERGNGYCSKI